MLRRVVLLLIVALLVLTPGGSAWHAPDTAALIQRGDAYREVYLYTAAADQYLQALDRSPADALILLRLCDVSLRRGLPDEAGRYADRAEAAGADRVEVADCRARAAEAGGQGQRAAAHWSIVVAARPADRDARVHLIEAHLAARDWPAALGAARALLDARPGDAAASFYLGALLALDDPARAQGYLRDAGIPEAAALAAVLADPLALADRAYRAVSLGRVFLDHDRLPLAWRALVAATAGNPQYPDAFAYLGVAYDRLGDAALAAAYLDRALEIDPDSVIGLYLRGAYLSRQARWAEARLDLDRAARLDPDSAPIAFALGRVMFEQAEYAAAEELLARAIAREPDNPDWHLALAELYLGRLIGVVDRGVPAARRAVELAPGDARARAWLGWGLHLSGDDAQAEFELRAAVQLDPALAQARLRLGNFLIDVGRIEEGRTELQRAVDLDPQGEAGARARRLLGVR
jgi:tetratricopeptide (TPR) repeat protein